MPAPNDGKKQQQNRYEKQPGGLGGVDGMAVLMSVMLLAVSCRLAGNGGVHAAIVAFSIAGRYLFVVNRSLVDGPPQTAFA